MTAKKPNTIKPLTNTQPEPVIRVQGTDLMDRVVSILEQARANVVRAVDSNMVIAYWLIGREIILELQRGEERAEYGKQVIENLSKELTRLYGKGFSVTTLQYFRKFYQVYSSRSPIPRPMGAESYDSSPVAISRPTGAISTAAKISYPAGSELNSFSSQLSWSHYRAFMRVDRPDARDFYEQETIECCWDKRSLERQIHSQFYERMLSSQTPQLMVERARQEIGEKHEGSRLHSSNIE